LTSPFVVVIDQGCAHVAFGVAFGGGGGGVLLLLLLLLLLLVVVVVVVACIGVAGAKWHVSVD
jgi:hypothetical protein